MGRAKQDIEFIVRYAPDMACQVRALLIILGDGKARPRVAPATGEGEERTDAQKQQDPRDGP